jgi:anti-sigma regulatory factor (Ser/Thr protein kinase)
MDPVARAAAEARRYVRRVLVELGRPELAETAELGVSELVTNATLHSRTPFEVRLVVGDDGAVRIEVTDSSPGVPVQKRHGDLATTGRGLRLLDAAGRWGVEPTPQGKTVWFEPAAALDESAFARAGGVDIELG